MTRCTAVIVSFHTGPVLFACLHTVLSQPELAEMVVVNNGNPPDVMARLQQMALGDPRIVIISGQGNVGFAKACNLGAARATGEFLLLLNPDCLLSPGALAAMMSAFAQVEGAVLVGPSIVGPDGKQQRGSRRQLLTPATALSEALGLHRMMRVKRLNNHETPMPEAAHEVPAISGACMCMHLCDYEQLHGMDEGFFLHVEDLDLCMRVHRLGGKVVCAPEVKVAHMLSTSGKVSSSFIEWQKAKGFKRYFKKHFEGQALPGMLPLLNVAITVRFALKVAIGFLRGGRNVHSVAAKRLMILATGPTELPENRELHGRTVLVTGATGQVGLCTVRRLLASGAAVLAMSRGDAIPYEHERLRCLRGDLTDSQLHLANYLPDIVIHCAPLWQLPAVIDLLAKSEVSRIVAFGSSSIFAKSLSKNEYEKDVVEKLTRAESMIAGQCAAKEIEWTILRPTLIYGLGLDVNVTSLAKFIRRFHFFPVYPPAFGRRQPVHADDLALGAIQALDAPASFCKSYNISGGEILTYRDMLERLFKLLRIKKRIIETTILPFALDVAGELLRKPHLNGEIARRMNDDLIFFHDDAKRDFGYSPRPFLSGGMRDIEGF